MATLKELKRNLNNAKATFETQGSDAGIKQLNKVNNQIFKEAKTLFQTQWQTKAKY